jgi:hypothetical protein
MQEAIVVEVLTERLAEFRKIFFDVHVLSLRPVLME